MSYHVTILRGQGQRHERIRDEELTQAVASFPELDYDAAAKEVVYRAEGETRARLFLTRGELWTKNPDRDVLDVMIRLANHLGARVRGDEFETYRTPDDWYIHPDDQGDLERTRKQVNIQLRRSKRQSYLIFASVMAFAAVLGLLVNRCTGG